MSTQDSIKKLIQHGKGASVEFILQSAIEQSQRNYKPIVNDKTLNERTITKRLAQRYRQEKQNIENALAREAEQAVANDRHDYLALFGTAGLNGDAASLAISRRDASDRVAAISDARELSNLLARSTRSGDEQLARACAERAMELGNADVINQFTSTRPDLEDTAQRVWQVNAEEPSVAQMFAVTGLMSGIKPAEIANIPDYKIDAVADAED